MLPEALLNLKEIFPAKIGYLEGLGFSKFLIEEDKVSDLVKLLGARSILFSYINREKTLLVEFQFIKFPDEAQVVSAASILNLKNRETITVEDYVKYRGLESLPEFPVEDVIAGYERILTGELLSVITGKNWVSVPY